MRAACASIVVVAKRPAVSADPGGWSNLPAAWRSLLLTGSEATCLLALFDHRPVAMDFHAQSDPSVSSVASVNVDVAAHRRGASINVKQSDVASGRRT